ncbi:MAG: hypothetical protein KJ811_01080, partial [Candidatus Margulisbacteria bacterium]|nr:hypothetical protein [Candidatus Margulisiibacteriota bacterium]
LGKLLQDETLNRKIIFGTDWSMTRHTWTEAEYVKPFREVIMPEFMAKVGFANPRRFLFPSNQFPTRIIDFYLEKNINLMDLFPKIKNNLEIELYHANIKPCEMAA